MRQIIDHKIEGVNDQLDIDAMLPPRAHEYLITATVPDLMTMQIVGGFGEIINLNEAELGIKIIELCRISFQNGSIHDAGINGVTVESMIAVCLDRLRIFQSGDLACDDNLDALIHLSAALACLQKRTRDHLSRKVS
jgi:hypothetical protein